MRGSKRRPQRNRYTFYVTWPENTEPPAGCPRAYRVWFPTRDAMTETAQGFIILGAEVSA